MTKGFVFGKFYPFHKGHEGLIQFALSKCDHIAVLICCSDLEKIDGETRKKWIEDTFPNHPNISVLIYHYSEQDLPNTSESSLYVSKKWSVVFKELLPDYEFIITSEPYGKYVANFMKIQSIDFDIARILYPISATLLRQNIFDYWDYLPISVKNYFTIKVVLLGTECTGKTSLAKALSKLFNASLVHESARDLIADSNDFNLHQLYNVIDAHTKQIKDCMQQGKPFIISDTDIHTTISYARFKLDQELDIPPPIYNIHQSHIYLYLNKDLPYEQDGTRFNENERNLLDASHREVLKERDINYFDITGNWDNRLEQCIEIINGYLAKHSYLLL